MTVRHVQYQGLSISIAPLSARITDAVTGEYVGMIQTANDHMWVGELRHDGALEVWMVDQQSMGHRTIVWNMFRMLRRVTSARVARRFSRL